MRLKAKLLFLLVFVLSMRMIITGQSNVGPVGLFFMLSGLVGLLILLFLYNKQGQ